MARLVSLRKSHPQKFWLKFFCDYLYYLGVGDCWYEQRKTWPTQKHWHKFWCIISNTYIFGGILNQFLAYLRHDLTSKEKNDLAQFILGQTAISMKVTAFHFNKNRIKKLLESLLERNREFSSLDLERASVKKAFGYCSILSILAYVALILTTAEAVVMYIIEDIPIRTEVTYYPEAGTPSLLFNFIRLLCEIHWYYSVTVVLMIDSICIFSIVFLAFKFKRLQIFFDEIRTQFLNDLDVKLLCDIEKEYEQGLLNGIKLHRDTLWSADKVQYALGALCSAQIVESIVLIIMCLIKMIRSVHDLAVVMSYFLYFLCVLIMTAAFMISSGDVTNEASLVPTAIFHCGWELNRPRRRLRTLVVMALMSSQRPVVITAFGIITLSYSNFVMLLRQSYSFFAVMRE